MMLLNVVNDGHGDEVAHTHLTSQEKPNFGTADIVLDELLDHVDIVFPWLQTSQSLINVGAAALHDE